MPPQTTEEVTPVWVRPATAAKMIGCSVSRVYELINSDTLTSRRQDRMRLISYQSILQLGTPSSE
jgi:hypothetical protein